MLNEIIISRSAGGVTNTELTEWKITQDCLAKELRAPVIGEKDGPYYLRCAGTYRNNADTVDVAPMLLLDGDSRINEDGEIVGGAPDPELVQLALASHEVNHVIYSSYSNGEHGDDYYKYRVIIFIEYDRKQLPILLDHFHELLHKEGVMLFNVKENRTWAQPWYFPRTTPERKHLFKFYEYLAGTTLDANAICAENEAAHPTEKPEPKHTPSTSKSHYSGLQISPIELFNRHWDSPVYYLMAQGYRYKNLRLLPPHCGEKSRYGVQICRECIDGIERVYSHHGNDRLNDGKPHDSFDCYKILEHNGDETAALIAVARSLLVNGMTLEKHNQIQHNKATALMSVNWVMLEAGL